MYGVLAMIHPLSAVADFRMSPTGGAPVEQNYFCPALVQPHPENGEPQEWRTPFPSRSSAKSYVLAAVMDYATLPALQLDLKLDLIHLPFIEASAFNPPNFSVR